MTRRSSGQSAALGFRAHSGWAWAILLAGSEEAIEILDRRRIELCDPRIPGSKQPFHEAEPMAFPKAEAHIARCATSTDALAKGALNDLLAVARRMNAKLIGACVLTASGRPLPDLRAILASHSLIHAAEGEFYRDALARACKAAKIKVGRLKEKEAALWTAERLGIAEGALKTKIANIGKTLGPPWTSDEKLATLAGLAGSAGLTGAPLLPRLASVLAFPP